MLDMLTKSAWIAALLFLVVAGFLSAWKGSSSRVKPPQEQQISNQRQPNEEKAKDNHINVFERVYSGIGSFIRLLDRHNGLVAAFGTLFVAIFTGVLVIATSALFYSSEKVARAAQKSAKVAEDTLIAGDRPWVGPETIDIVPLTVGGTFQATIRWRNTGHSPALQARIYTEGRKVDVGDPEPTRLTEFPAEVDTTLMMPNEVGATLIFHNSRINNQAAVDAIKNGTIKLWLLGLAEYSDIYGRVHTTVFRERYDPDVGAYRSIDGTAN
jgi:hypothetical protein